MKKFVIFSVILCLITVQVHCGDYDSLQIKYTKTVDFEGTDDGPSETCLVQSSSSEATSEDNDYSNYRCSCSVVKKVIIHIGSYNL